MSDWIQVRLRRKTHHALRALAASWDDQYQRGNRNVPETPDKGLSIDAVVEELIRRVYEHRARSHNDKAAGRALDALQGDRAECPVSEDKDRS